MHICFDRLVISLAFLLSDNFESICSRQFLYFCNYVCRTLRKGCGEGNARIGEQICILCELDR